MKPLTLKTLSLTLLAFGLTLTPAHAWGRKGHEMTARVAVRSLPADVPLFFRGAEIELGYLCPEPDRWRVEKREPALKGLADRDHWIKLENITKPLPANRYDYLLQYFGTPKKNGGVYGYSDLGYAPYAMAEYSEMLAVNFMLWRRAPDLSNAEKRIKRQIEQNIIHIAGLLAHFVTDTGQPLHTTIHIAGWSAEAPNPGGYVGEKIHGRFEDIYLNQAIEEKDFENLVGPPRALGVWLDEAMQHIRATHAHVETVYALDKANPFGSGKETAEAKRFTCEMLAHSSQSLRDFWYSAWIKSAALPEK
jgi:hypothetical protein